MPKRRRSTSYGSRKRRRFSKSRKYRRYSRYSRRRLSLRTRVKSLEKNVEKKWAEVEQSYTPALNWIGSRLLPNIDGGVGTGSERDRIGNRITLKSLQCFLRIQAGDASNKVRVIIIRWPQSTGASNVGDALSTPAVVLGSSILPIQSLYKKASPILFKVMYDRTFSVNSTTADTRLAKISLKLPKSGMVLYYENETDTQPTKGLLDMYVVSDSQAVAHPLVVANTRITYADS